MKEIEIEKIQLRFSSLEVRSCNSSLCLSSPYTTLEVVYWEENNKNCYTIAYWLLDKEGYYLKFVGSRPFGKEIDSNLFWKITKIGQDFLDDIFEDYRKED